MSWTDEEFLKAGTRIFTLEKMFNYREGLRREDDTIPEKFLRQEFSYGNHKGAIVEREDFTRYLNGYYKKRRWNPEKSNPENEVLREPGLEYTI